MLKATWSQSVSCLKQVIIIILTMHLIPRIRGEGLGIQGLNELAACLTTPFYKQKKGKLTATDYK